MIERTLRSVPAILCLLATTGAGTAQAQPPFVWEIADGGSVGLNTSLVLDGKGNPHMVYWDFGGGTLRYATKQNGVWTYETIEATAFVGSETSIAMDALDQPHVSYHNFAGSDEVLRYAVRTGGKGHQ